MNDLSDYFTEEAVSNVEKDIDKEIICINDDSELIGFIIFKVEFSVSEILWMAIDKYHQGRKYGSSIMASFESMMKERNVKSIIVKTLDDSANYKPYHSTTRFYRRNGFIKIHHIDLLPEWGPDNPCAVYKKTLK